MEKIELQVIVIPFKVVTQYTVWGQSEYMSSDLLIMCTLIYSSHFYKIEAVSLIFIAVQLQELQFLLFFCIDANGRNLKLLFEGKYA